MAFFDVRSLSPLSVVRLCRIAEGGHSNHFLIQLKGKAHSKLKIH